MLVTDTRRSIMETNYEYARGDGGFTIARTEKVDISNLEPSEYCLSTRSQKYDTSGSPRYYSDVPVADIDVGRRHDRPKEILGQ